MKDHLPKHQSVNLPKYKWGSFFADLAESQKGRPVAVSQGGDLLLLDPPTVTAPLVAIDYQSAHKGKLTITTDEPTSETTTISAPNLVWVVHDVDGRVIAIEIIDEHDHNVVIRFEQP